MKNSFILVALLSVGIGSVAFGAQDKALEKDCERKCELGQNCNKSNDGEIKANKSQVKNDSLNRPRIHIDKAIW